MEQQKKIKLYQSRDFGGNFDTSIAFIKQNYGAILKSLLIFIPVLLVAVYLFMDILTFSTAGVYAQTDPEGVFFSIFSWKFFVGMLLIMVASYITYLYPFCYMVAYEESTDGVVNSADVWAKVRKSALPLIGYGIIYFILVLIGTMLCFIPGIIIGVYLSLYIYVYLVEDRGVVQTFQRSYDLVSHNWWVTFGLMILFWLIIIVISFVFTLPVYGTMLGTLLKIDFLTGDIYIYITNLIRYIVSFFLNPVLCLVLGVMYYSYRNKLEGISTYDEIDQIGTNRDTQY
ncbi:MAG: hypothetical protein LBN74_10465 [Prevotella sp.]|jgi:hypothetical protein|nr:hypothetical protein [Prevotella sp.]